MKGLGGGARARVLHALAVVVVPLLGAGLALHALVPAAGYGVAGEVARVGRPYPLPFGAALFLLFSVLARYWLGRFSGGRESAPVLAVPPLASPRRAMRTASVALSLVGVAAATGAGVLLRAVARPYRVEGASMLPTLEPGDVVAGRSRPRRAPERGDVVVFHQRGRGLVGAAPGEVDREVVKRVIGLPGDRIEMHGSQPLISGWAVPSCDAGEYLYITRDGEQAVRGRVRVEFLGDRVYLTVFALTKPFFEAYTVKPGELFVLGDDRGNSLDSREYGAGGRAGGVALGAVEARVERFLAGADRSGELDLGRFLHSIGELRARSTLDPSARSLEDGVARCLANRPAVTDAPLPVPLPLSAEENCSAARATPF